MNKYQETVLDPFGNAVPGASVTVYLTGTTTLATLYSDSGGTIPKTNPLTTDTLGGFSFYATDAHHYDLLIAGTGITTRTVSDVVVPADQASASYDTGYIYAANNPYHNAPGGLGATQDTSDLTTLISILNATFTGATAPGWTLVLAPNFYDINADSLIITGPNKSIIGGFGSHSYPGSGMGLPTIRAATSGSFLIKYDGQGGVSVGNSLKNVAFFANGHTFTTAMLWMNGQGNFRFLDNYITGAGGTTYTNDLTYGTLFQAFEDSTIRGNQWTRMAVSGAGVGFEIADRANPNSQNCNDINFYDNHIESIQYGDGSGKGGTFLKISDKCNADGIRISYTKFERGQLGNASAAVVPCIAFYHAFSTTFINNEVQNISQSTTGSTSHTDLISVSSSALSVAGHAGTIIKNNRFENISSRSNIVVYGNAASVIIKDNVGVNSCSFRVFGSNPTTGASNYFEQIRGNAVIGNYTVDASRYDVQAGNTSLSRAYEHEPIGYTPVNMWSKDAANSFTGDNGYGNFIYNGNQVYYPTDVGTHTILDTGKYVLDFATSALAKFKDGPYNVHFDFLCRRTVDEPTPYSNSSYNSALSYYGAANIEHRLPPMPSLPKTSGITSIVGDGVTATVTTNVNHGLVGSPQVFIRNGANTSFNTGNTPVTATVVDSTTFTFPSATAASAGVGGGVRQNNIDNIVGDGTTVTLTPKLANITTAVLTSSDGTVTITADENAIFSDPEIGNLITLYQIDAGSGPVDYVDCRVSSVSTNSIGVLPPSGISFTAGTYTGGQCFAPPVVTGDWILVSQTNNYDSTIRTPVQITVDTTSRVFTYSSSQNATAETSGNWVEVPWVNVPYTVSSGEFHKLGQNTSSTTVDKMNFKYNSTTGGARTDGAPIAIKGVGLTAQIPHIPFQFETVQTSASGVDLSTTDVLCSRYVRQGLTADATDTMPNVQDIVRAAGSISWNGAQSFWEVVNETPYNLTIARSPDWSLGLDFDLRDVRNVSRATEVILPWTTAIFRLAWARTDWNVPVARMRRLGTVQQFSIPRQATQTDTTDSDHVIAASKMICDELYVSGYTAPRVVDVTTATSLIPAMTNAELFVGRAWRWKVVNNSPVYFTLTNPGGAVTFTNVVIPPGHTYDFLITITNISLVGAAAYTCTLINKTKNSLTTQLTAIGSNAGGGQGSATVLRGLSNRVDTVATAGDSVKLDTIWDTGIVTRVFNGTSTSMDLFPAVGGSFNNLAANTGISIAGGTGVTLEHFGSNVWRIC
jgi:hypothetical protein